MSIAERIKKIRLSLKLSQREFGKRLKIRQGHVQAWEAGTSLPGSEYLIQISEAFNVNIHWLLTGHGAQYICYENKNNGYFGGTDFQIADIIQKAIAILESKTIYRQALYHNINAFYQAVTNTSSTEARLTDLERQVAILRQENEEQKKRIRMLQNEDSEESLVGSDTGTE